MMQQSLVTLALFLNAVLAIPSFTTGRAMSKRDDYNTIVYQGGSTADYCTVRSTPS